MLQPIAYKNIAKLMLSQSVDHHILYALEKYHSSSLRAQQPILTNNTNHLRKSKALNFPLIQSGFALPRNFLLLRAERSCPR